MARAASTDEQLDRRRAAWMAAAQAGDRAAYERVLADSVALIRAIARRHAIAHDHLDDVVQETLLSVHRVRHTYDPRRSYAAWLGARAAIAALPPGQREAAEQLGLRERSLGEVASRSG